jgi:O-antigen ligase
MNARANAARLPRAVAGPLTLAVVVLGSAALGVLLMRVAVVFEDSAPLVALALPAVPLAALAILNDPRLSVALVFVTFPIGFTALSLGPFRLQATEIAIFAAVLLVGFVRVGSSRVPLLWPSRLFAAGALIAWAVAVSFPAAFDQALAIKQLLTLTSGVVFVTLIVTVCPDLRAVRFLVGVLVAVAALIATTSLASAGSTQTFYGGAVVEGRAQGLFIEPNELGCFCSMAGLAAIGLALGARTFRGRMLAGLGVALILAALALSLSRGAWLGTFAGLMFLLLMVSQARRAVALLAVPLVMAAVFVNAFLPDHPRVQVIGERARVLTKSDQPYEGRPAIWNEALRQIRAEPVSGSGPGNFSVGSRRLASTGETVYTRHAHNLYLNTAAELGLPGLALLLALIATLAVTALTTLRALKRQSRPGDRAVVAGLAAGVLSFGVQGLTNTFVGNPVIDATAWGLAGFLLVAFRDARAAGLGAQAPRSSANAL